MGSSFPLEFPRCSLVLWLLACLWKSLMSFGFADLPKSFISWRELGASHGPSSGEAYRVFKVMYLVVSLLFTTLGPRTLSVRSLSSRSEKLSFHYLGKPAAFWQLTPHFLPIFRASFSRTVGVCMLGLSLILSFSLYFFLLSFLAYIEGDFFNGTLQVFAWIFKKISVLTF